MTGYSHTLAHVRRTPAVRLISRTEIIGFMRSQEPVDIGKFVGGPSATSPRTASRPTRLDLSGSQSRTDEVSPDLYRKRPVSVPRIRPCSTRSSENAEDHLGPVK